MKILGPWRRPRHRTVLPGSNLSEAAIGVAIRSCPGVQPRRSYSRLDAIIADSASFANSADRFANNFASDKFDPAKYHDTYTEDVKKLIEDKAKGQSARCRRRNPPAAT